MNDHAELETSSNDIFFCRIRLGVPSIRPICLDRSKSHNTIASASLGELIAPRQCGEHVHRVLPDQLTAKTHTSAHKICTITNIIRKKPQRTQ